VVCHQLRVQAPAHAINLEMVLQAIGDVTATRWKVRVVFNARGDGTACSVAAVQPVCGRVDRAKEHCIAAPDPPGRDVWVVDDLELVVRAVTGASSVVPAAEWCAPRRYHTLHAIRLVAECQRQNITYMEYIDDL